MIYKRMSFLVGYVGWRESFFDEGTMKKFFDYVIQVLHQIPVKIYLRLLFFGLKWVYSTVHNFRLIRFIIQVTSIKKGPVGFVRLNSRVMRSLLSPAPRWNKPGRRISPRSPINTGKKGS